MRAIWPLTNAVPCVSPLASSRPRVPTTHHLRRPRRPRAQRLPHGDDDHHHHDDDAATPWRRVLRARGRPGRRRRRRCHNAVAAHGGGEGEEGESAGVGEAAAAVAVRGAAGLPPRQRVHPGALPLRVVRPRRPPQRLRLAQRDAQRLDPPGRLLPLPGPRRRQRDGVGGRRSGTGLHDDGDDLSQRVVVGGEQHHLDPGEPERAGLRRRARGGEVAADGVRVRRHDVPLRQRGGAPAGVPLAPLQPALLAARLRGHRHHDRLLLLPARLLHLPRQPRRAARLPLRHHPARRARRRRAARAGAVLAAAPAHPRGPLRVHGPLGRRAGAARALAQLGPPRVLPRALARARHGARLRHGGRVLRRQGAGEVAPGHVRLRWPQPPDLPRIRACRRALALRRHRHPHRLARGHGRRRRGGVGVVVTRRAERDHVYVVGVGCDIDSLICARSVDDSLDSRVLNRYVSGGCGDSGETL